MGWREALRRALAPPPAPAPAPTREVSRRALLGGDLIRRLAQTLADPVAERVAAAAAVVDRLERPAPPPARPIPVLRPPGAIAEPAFLAGCTRCLDCARACPHGAIAAGPLRLRAAAGTPMIDPAQQPCLMCHDLPCITACAPAVLQRTATPRLGIARIQPLDCLAHQGTTCITCVERCPVPGAIRLDGARPVIDPALCTGCGVCHHVCPSPRNAVLVLPDRERA